MVRAVFTVQDSLVSTQEDGLVGLNDLQLVQTGGGMHLFATARGGGYLTGYDIGTAAGDTAQAGFWQIGFQYLQLESVDLVVRDAASGPQLYLAGLVGAALRGVRLDSDDQGALIESQISVTTPGLSLGQITEMELFGTSDQGLAAMRGGGVINVSFGAGTILGASPINEGPGLATARAGDILTTTHNGQSYAFVSYGAEDTVAMYQLGGGGSVSLVGTVDADVGLWVDNPGAMTVTTAVDGGLYVVVAATGSDSLSVLSVTSGGMQVVDHVLDTRDTRFDSASHVESVTIAGQSYVLAAGADSGISLFVMLPGGRLQHVETFEATLDAPLNGITALEAMAVPNGIRVWVSTEAAPYLSELSISLQNVGFAVVGADTGSTMGGGLDNDVLAGGAGADSIAAGAGDDILMDGGGADTLRGGVGQDTFIFARDGDLDVIRDFDPTQDVIDVSGIGTLGGTNELVVASRSWGAFIRFGDEIIEVRTADGSALDASDFTAGTLITGGRVEVDPTLYPDPGTADPPPPDGGGSGGGGNNNGGGGGDTGGGSGGTGGGGDGGASGGGGGSTDLPPTQMPGALPEFDAWLASPSFTLDPDRASKMGDADPNNILTFGASDYVFGMFGNDTIRSGNGNDSVSGGSGNDAIDSGAGSDVVMGGTGFDTIMAGNGADTVAGGDGADSIRAGSGNDVLIGGQGYDHIHGEDGNDSIWGGAIADRLYGGAGNDFISAGSNFGITVDGVWGDAGNDILYGDGGYDYLDGGTGDDTIDGGAQADNLFGRDGQDLLLGSGGLDRLFGGADDDRLYGGEGSDGHFGEWGNDSLWGGSGNDRFFGGSGDDVIDGGADNDTLYGGADFDTIVGGAGDDSLFGNFNADRFVFANFHGHDTIGDFNPLNSLERIDMTGMTQINSFAQVAALFEQVGGDVVISTGVSSSIRLTGVQLNDLDETDFIF